MRKSRRGDSPSSGRTDASRRKTPKPATSGSTSGVVIPLLGSATDGRRPCRTILREEEYLSTLGAILRRDFFPTLDRLEAQHEYLTAMERDDLVALREAADRLNILEYQRQQRANQPGYTSRTGDLNLSLDEFQARYVTEDTAEFEELLARINAARLAKYRKNFGKNVVAATGTTLTLASPSQPAAASSSLMLRAAPDLTISQGSLGEVRPEGTRLEVELELGILERDPTDIRHHYWRMLREYGSGEETGREPSIISSSISQMGGANNPSGRHYNFVETPQRDAADAEEALLRDPSHFRIPPTPSREALGHKMAASITAASPSALSSSLLSSLASPGGPSQGLRERRRKLLLKSPAVQRLLRAHTPHRTDSVFDTPRRPHK